MSSLPYLIWFFIGVGFLASEFIVPAFILIFFTGGSWIVAAALYFVPGFSYTTQLTIFTVSSLVLLFSLRRLLLPVFRGERKKGVVRDFTKVGSRGVVTVAIPDKGLGEVGLDGSFWKALADVPIDEGQSVLIVAQDPTNHLILKVKPLS